MLRVKIQGDLPRGETHMNGLHTVKSWVGSLTEVALMLLALGIALALLAGPQVPFLGNVVGNIVAMVNELGKNGIVGLIALGIILWLFSNRSVS
jgi:ABC-type enterochelin transport system permease subunit